MPLNIPTGYYQAAFHHQLSNTIRRAVCTVGLQYTGADFTNNANGVRGAWATHIMPVLGSGVVYDRLTLTDDTGTIYDSSTSAAGGITNPSCPWNTAYLVKKTTGQAGRANRGRLYLPGVEEEDVDNAGIIETVKLGSIQTALAAFQTAVETNDFTLEILHNSVTTPTSVVALQCQTQVATQRRRLRG